MSRNSLLPACVLAMMAVTFSAGTVWAQPKLPEIPDDLLTAEGPLLNMYQEQIDARIDWWKKRMLIARDEKDILASRQGLLSDYLLYNNNKYRSYYATQAGKDFLGMISGKDYPKDTPLQTVKQINCAMALSHMSVPAIQPALDAMVASPNEGIRFIGWKGYANIAKSLLLLDKAKSNILLAAMKKAIQAEKNPLLIKQILDVMNLSGRDAAEIKSDARAQIQAKLLNILAGSWNEWRKAIQAGNLDILQILPTAVSVLSDAGKDLSTDKAAVANVLQMMVNMADTAATVYAKNWKLQEKAQLVAACQGLLLSCEAGFNKMIEQPKDFIDKTIKAPLTEVGDKGAAMQQAVLNWVDALSKLKLGVKDPQPIQAPAPAKKANS